MEIIRDIWLCSDCMPVAVNGDYSHLDYAYEPKAAERLAREIDAGLDALPGLVPDFGSDDLECDDCGYTHFASRFRYIDYPEHRQHICPQCESEEISERESGEEEFSWRDCDCCGTDLGGSRFRFAQLIRDEVTA